MFYLDLFQALEQHGVRYLLVGGLALNIHGVERATMDVDLVVALDEKNLAAFLETAGVLGLTPVAPVPLADFADEAKRRLWAEEKGMVAFALRPRNPRAPTVDVLIQPTIEFEAAWQRRMARDLGSLRVEVASIDDLIVLKSGTGRMKDDADVAALIRLKQLREQR